MPHFLTHCWQTLSAPANRARERLRIREYERAMKACACTATVKTNRPDDEANRTERLEHIAAYARAGYFNMGYTTDVFQSPADLPPH